MKKSIIYLFTLIASAASAQMQIDKSIQMTGTNSSDRAVTNLSPPVNGTDAANKDYVDAQIATVSAGGGSDMPSMMSNEGSAVTLSGAVQYCKNLVEGGYSDWRLPTIDELVYFVGDGGVGSNYLWTKSLAPGKENPVNQNYMTIRLTDGKWRNAGEVTGLLAARTLNSSVPTANILSNYSLMGSITPLTSGNIFIITHLTLTGRNSSTSAGNSFYRLKFYFADGSSAYSGEFSQNSSSAAYVTLIDMQSIPLLTSITPVISIDLEMKTTNTGYTAYYTLVVSGYEIAMTQADNATLATRCVR